MNIMDYLTVTEEYPDKVYAIFDKDKNEVKRLTNKKCFMSLKDNEEIRRVSHFVQVIIDSNALKNDGYIVEEGEGYDRRTTYTFDIKAELKAAFPDVQFYGLFPGDIELTKNKNNRQEVNLYKSHHFYIDFTTYWCITNDDIKKIISAPKHIKTKKAAIQQKQATTENIRKTFNTFVRPNLKAVVDDMLSKPENIDIEDGLQYLSQVLEKDIWHLCLPDDILQKICDDALYKFLTDNFGPCGLKFDRSKIQLSVPYTYTLDLDADSPMSFDLGQD